MSKNGMILVPGGADPGLAAVVKELQREREIMRENLRNAARSIEELRALANRREEQRAAASILLGLAILAAGGELRVSQEQQREMAGRKAKITRSRDDATGDWVWRVQQ